MHWQWPVDDETVNFVAALDQGLVSIHRYDPCDMYCGSPAPRTVARRIIRAARSR